MRCLFVLCFLCFAGSVFANDVVNTPTKNTPVSNTQVGTAKDWILTETEWNKYLLVMQGPSGHYYQKLSPPEVLGIQANTTEELQHYAEIAAKLEHDKLERELRFNAAFHDAANKLYSTEPIIRPFDLAPFTPIPKS